MHVCRPKIQHVLVWSDRNEYVDEAIKILMDEFDESLFAFSIEDIPTVVERTEIGQIEEEIEKYDFHVIKIKDSAVHVVLIDNNHHIIDAEGELEEALGKAARHIIKFRFDNVD